MIALRPGTRPPWVIGHRGACSTFPENTPASFDAALDQGCDGIELDVQLSRDRIPVVYRPQLLQRAGGGRRRAFQLEYRELRRLDVGAWFGTRFRGQRMPSLGQMLRRYGARTRLLLELKARPREKLGAWHHVLAEIVADLVRSLRLRRRVMILSFDHDTLSAVSRRDPLLRTAWNVRGSSWVNGARRKKLGRIHALCIDVRALSPTAVRAAHRLGKPVIAYTCNTPAAAGRAAGAGADAIMSDRPGWLRRFLEDRD